MAINSLGKPQTYDLIAPAERFPARGASAPPPGAAGASRADEVTLSPAALKLQAGVALQQKPLAGVEAQVGRLNEQAEQLLDKSYGELLERAGRSDYLASIANPDDRSPEATAGRILGGVTGYIYDAYKLQNPDMDAAQLEKFQVQAIKGFEQGLGEAKQIIEAMGMLDGSMSSNIGKTEALVRSGMADFFKVERERLERGAGTGGGGEPRAAQAVGGAALAEGPAAAERTQRPRRVTDRNEAQAQPDDFAQGRARSFERAYGVTGRNS